MLTYAVAVQNFELEVASLNNFHKQQIRYSIYLLYWYNQELHLLALLVASLNHNEQIRYSIYLLYVVYLILSDRVYLCPVSVDTQLTVFVSQILMLLSSLPLATCLPYGQKQTLKTFL